MAKSIGEILIDIRVAGENESIRKINRSISLAKRQGRIQELQRQLAHRQAQKDRKKEIDSLRKLEKQKKDLAKQQKKINQLYTKFGKILQTGVVAGLATVGFALERLTTSSFEVGKGFTQSLQAVRAIANPTDEAFKDIEDTVRKLGQSTSFTASEAADAMIVLARSGIRAEGLLSATTASVYFAGAAVSSLRASTGILTGALRQFNLQENQSIAVTDVFSVALKETLFDMQSLTAAMRYGGSIGASFGMSIEETTAALAQFRNLGLEGSTAGTQFRMAMAKAAKQTNLATAALDKYNLSFKDINPEMNSFRQIMINVGKANMDMQDIITVFGVRQAGSIARISQVMAESSEEYDKLLANLRHSTGATKALYEEMQDTVQKQLDITKSAGQEFQITLFKQAENATKTFLKSVTKSLQRTSEVTSLVADRTTKEFDRVFGLLAKSIEGQQKNISALGFEMSFTLLQGLETLAVFLPSMVQAFRSFVKILQTTIRAFRGVVLTALEMANTFRYFAETLNPISLGFGLFSTKLKDYNRTIDLAIRLTASLAVGLTSLMIANTVASAFAVLRTAVAAYTAAITTARTATLAFQTIFAAIRRDVKQLLVVFGTVSAFVGFSAKFQDQTEAVELATSAIDEYLDRLNRLKESEDIKFLPQDQVKAVDKFLNRLRSISPALEKNNKAIFDSIDATSNWNQQNATLLENSGKLISLRERDDTYYLTLLDALEARLMLEERINEIDLSNVKIGDPKITEYRALKEEAGKLDKALDDHMSKLTEQKTAYEDLNNFLKRYTKKFNENSSIREGAASTEFEGLRVSLGEIVSKYDGLSDSQKEFLKETINGIKDIDNFKTSVRGLGDEAKDAANKYNQAQAVIEKVKIDQAREGKKGSKDPDPTPRKGKSQAQRLLEQRLKLIKKINREERDINASTTEEARNRLADRLESLKEHFDKELKLYRNNARKKKEILQVQSELEQKLINNSFSEEMNALTQLGNKFRENATEQKNERAKIIADKEEDKQKLLKEFEQLKNIAGIQDHINKLNTKHRKKSKGYRDKVVEFTLGTTADNVKMLGSLFNKLESEATSYQQRQHQSSEALEEFRMRVAASEATVNSLKHEQGQLNHEYDKFSGQLKKLPKAYTEEFNKSWRDLSEGQRKSFGSYQQYANHIKEEEGYLAASVSLINKQRIKNQEKLTKAEKQLAFDRLFLRRQEQTDVISLSEMVNKKLKQIKKKGYERTLEDEKEFIKKVISLGISSNDAQELFERMHLSKKELMQREYHDNIGHINKTAQKKLQDLDKRIEQDRERARRALSEDDKSLYAQLLRQKEAAVSRAAELDDFQQRKMAKFYDEMIPKVIARALDKELDLYGNRTTEILSLEQKLFDAQFDGKKLRESETVAQKKLKVELEFQKELLKIDKERARIEEQFANLKDADNVKKRKELLDRLNQQTTNAITEKNAKITSLDADQLKEQANFYMKIVGYAKKAAETIKQIWTSIFNVIGTVTSIGLDSFEKLTGFSFDLSSGLSDVISQMKDLDDSEITKGVVEGRLSPQMAQEAREGQATDPKSAAREYIDNLIEESLRFIDVFAEAGPELIKRLGQKLPEITAKLAEALPQAVAGFSEALPVLFDGVATAAIDFIGVIVENLPDLVTDLVSTLVDKLPEFIEKLSIELPKLAKALLNSIVTVLPILLRGIIEILPDLILVAVEAIIQLIPLIINAFVFELIPKLPEIALILVSGIVRGIGVLLFSIVKAIGDFLGFDTSGLGSAIEGMGGSSYESPTGFESGIAYVPKTMLARLHQGEAVIPADVNARRQHPQNPAQAGVGAIGARMPMSSPQPIDIAVMAEGRLLDAVQVLAMDRGHAPKLNKKFRRASGVKVGFSRGKYAKYSN